MEKEFTLVDAVADVTTYMGQALDFIAENEVLLLFLAAGVVSMALGLFGKAKRVAH